MVVTLFLLGERAGGGAVTGAVGAVMVGKSVGGVSFVVTVTGGGLLVGRATGFARVVCISALRAKATLNFSLISSICSCSSCNSPGLGGAGVGGVNDTGGVVIAAVVGATYTVGGVLDTGGGALGTVRGASDAGRGALNTGGVALYTVGGALDTVGGALGRAEEAAVRESTRLAKEAAGPPFSYKLLVSPTLGLAGSLLLLLAPPPLASEDARRASRRRVLRVSRLN